MALYTYGSLLCPFPTALRWPSEAGAGYRGETPHSSIETGALFSNVHTADSLYNQGNGFSFRHLTLLSKENPSYLVPPWAEDALSSFDPKQKAMGSTGTLHGTPTMHRP